MENSVEGKPCINRRSKSLELTIYLYSCYDEHEVPSSCDTTVYLSGLKIKEITVSNENQVDQEGGGGAGHFQGVNLYRNTSTVKKFNYKSDIADLEDVVFTQGRPYDATIYEYLIKVLLNCVHWKDSACAYLGKSI